MPGARRGTCGLLLSFLAAPPMDGSLGGVVDKLGTWWKGAVLLHLLHRQRLLLGHPVQLHSSMVAKEAAAAYP
jgi:hypothetical protein